MPKKVTYGKGQFRLNSNTKIIAPIANEEIKELSKLFVDLISASTGFSIALKEGNVNRMKRNTIIIKTDETLLLNEEGYYLSVAKKGIVISAKTPTGLFYGLQTLRQLLPPEIEKCTSPNISEWTIPCLEIEDEPRFQYRGLLLDVARHFYPKEVIKKFIEVFGYYKLNYFQLHLTDDQGWRIEIKKYPRLTKIASYRKETLIGHNSDPIKTYDGKRYGGFYTQDDIREIVNYAKKYYVTILPEIEMPGHSVAALTAYPELGCTGGPYNVRTFWGVSRDVLCAGKEYTFQFLDDVLSEVADLFPCEYIHIGGDECPKGRWEECEKCQARIIKEGLNDEHELQSYFIHRIENILNAKGKNLIGWDEILEGGLAPKATVMSWRGVKGGIEAAKMGHQVIMSPTSHCYLDYYQSEDIEDEPLAIGGYLPLSKVYAFEPQNGLTPEESKFILGGQGNTWTEYMKTPEHVEFMVFPRACALSEVFWTPAELRDYVGFLERMKNHQLRLENMNVKYRKIEN